MGPNIDVKFEKLKELIEKQHSVIVAFSGGVDSSFLAKVAYEVLGNNALAITVASQTIAGSEVEAAREVARSIGVRHRVLEYDELWDSNIVKNPTNRCYFCKKNLLGFLEKIKLEEGFDRVIEGTCAEELGEHRPGYDAVRESNTISPLVELEFKKEEIIELAKKLGLPNWDKPSKACLSSRIPYGEEINAEKLGRIEAAEDYLGELGIRQFRVRSHESIARIEVEEEDFPVILKNKKDIAKKLRELGFNYVTLDLQGFRSGSMNEKRGI
ncbi:MAG: ATP-dependent sacrificial sulfur transferase LarE [Candidatus Altiarchaeota archaeon]